MEHGAKREAEEAQRELISECGLQANRGLRLRLGGNAERKIDILIELFSGGTVQAH